MGGVVLTPGEAQTVIKVEGTTADETVLDYGSGDKFKITVSNHCDQPECEYRSDFFHYYKIFDKSSLANRNEYELASPVVRGYRAPCNIIFSSSDLG